MNDKDRDELLIRLDERQNTIKTILCNHIKHHFRLNILIAGIVLTIIAGKVISLFF